jgi:hypothetical protein
MKPLLALPCDVTHLHGFVMPMGARKPPPEKFHGLKDVDARFRHREQDLVATPRTRYRMIAAIRQFLYERDFIEVETPMLHVIPGGALAKPFITHHNKLDMPLYLRVAPELHLNRLVIGGLAEKLFEINRCFKLMQPTHVVDLPRDISPLAKAWPGRPHNVLKLSSMVGRSLTTRGSSAHVSANKLSRNMDLTSHRIRSTKISFRRSRSACRRWVGLASASTGLLC